MSKGDTYRPTQGVHARKFGEELVLLDLTGGVYFSLNAVGAAIWEALCAGTSELDLPSAVAAQFEVSVEVARAEAGNFVDELVQAGLIAPVVAGEAVSQR